MRIHELRKTSGNEVFTYHEIQLKKLLLRTYSELQQASISTSTNIKQIYVRVLVGNNALTRVASLLSYQQKNVLSNFFIGIQSKYYFVILMFTSIRFYRKINKLHGR